MAFEISCPTCTSLVTERTIAGAMKLALAHAPAFAGVHSRRRCAHHVECPPSLRPPTPHR